MPRDTRTKILDAGLRLFSKKGYLRATTREIARKAGVAELTLFRHFSSKELLFEEIINTFTFLPTLRGLLPEIKNMPYEEALAEIARRFLERLLERKELIRIMHSESQLYPEKVREIYHNFIHEMFRTLASYFAELQDAGVLRNFNPELAARAFLGMFFSYFNAREMMAYRAAKAADPADAVQAYVDIFVNGTLGPALRPEEGAGGKTPAALKRAS